MAPEHADNNIWVALLPLLLTACGGEPDDTAVRAYLLEHPEIVLDNPEVKQAISAAAEQRRRQAEESARRYVLANNRQIIRSPLTPTLGNASANISIIQFSDYQCAPCKQTYGELEIVKNSRDDIEVLYLELPVYGSNSELAARAAIAANVNGVFVDYHRSLMQSDAMLDVARIREAAIAAGMTDAQVENSFANPETIEYLAELRELAEKLDVNGTPTYLIGNELVRGGMTAAQFTAALNRQLPSEIRSR